MEHEFTGPSYTIGIEEELMILDADSLDLSNSIETLLDATSGGEVRPELMESVLEVATSPTRNTAEAGPQLKGLRRAVIQAAPEKGLRICSAGPHPLAPWEEQRILARPPYPHLIAALRFVARQEIIFGLHVHVGVDDPDKAIHVADGMRVHLPVLLALSANSPFWRGDSTGLASTRTPIFRAFPRVGIPPAYHDWENYVKQIDFLVSTRVIEDYTYLWYDVRPHPRFGTVEIRVADAQTRADHTLALAALVQSLVQELCVHYEEGKRFGSYPHEMLDENKWLAARHGLEGELVDLPTNNRVRTRDLALRLYDRMKEHAQDLGSAAELEGIRDLIDRGNGAARQVVVWEANSDIREVVAEIVEATAA